MNESINVEDINNLKIPDTIILLVYLNTKLHVFKDCNFGRFGDYSKSIIITFKNNLVRHFKGIC